MSFEKVGEVKEAHTIEDANKLLRNGWLLLAAVPNASVNTGAVVYVLGKHRPQSLNNPLALSTQRR